MFQNFNGKEPLPSHQPSRATWLSGVWCYPSLVALWLVLFTACPLMPPADTKASWSVYTGEPVLCTPLVLDNNAVLVLGLHGMLSKIQNVGSPDARLAWQLDLDEKCTVSPQRAGDGTIYISGSEGGVYAVRDDLSTGTLLWAYRPESPRTETSPLQIGTTQLFRENHLYDDMTILTRSTGALVKQMERELLSSPQGLDGHPLFEVLGQRTQTVEIPNMDGTILTYEITDGHQLQKADGSQVEILFPPQPEFDPLTDDPASILPFDWYNPGTARFYIQNNELRAAVQLGSYQTDVLIPDEVESLVVRINDDGSIHNLYSLDLSASGIAYPSPHPSYLENGRFVYQVSMGGIILPGNTHACHTWNIEDGSYQGGWEWELTNEYFTSNDYAYIRSSWFSEDDVLWYFYETNGGLSQFANKRFLGSQSKNGAVLSRSNPVEFIFPNKDLIGNPELLAGALVVCFVDGTVQGYLIDGLGSIPRGVQK